MSEQPTGTTTPSHARRRLDRPAEFIRPLPESAGWGALNTMISGIALFTVLAWLTGRWLDAPWITAIGMVAGMAAGVTGIWFRYGTGRVAPDNDIETAGHTEPVERTSDTKENR